MKPRVPRLSQFDNGAYHPGRSLLVQILWFAFGAPLLRSKVVPFNSVRCALLRLFGAQLGCGLVVKPGVRVKYPWRLSVGSFSWLGEDCWIDNVANVSLGENVCLSQGAYLCTGNHDWSDVRFALIASPIVVQDGAWIGAKAVVGPGVYVNQCGIVTLGSVAVRDVPPYEIHAGNPACLLRKRLIREDVVCDPGIRELTSSEIQ
ncbi:MAG: WcaF family extracellular polysaccharide biosynthesis acetyltransferase [Bryobacteraceae bacterium]